MMGKSRTNALTTVFVVLIVAVIAITGAIIFWNVSKPTPRNGPTAKPVSATAPQEVPAPKIQYSWSTKAPDGMTVAEGTTKPDVRYPVFSSTTMDANVIDRINGDITTRIRGIIDNYNLFVNGGKTWISETLRTAITYLGDDYVVVHFDDAYFGGTTGTTQINSDDRVYSLKDGSVVSADAYTDAVKQAIGSDEQVLEGTVFIGNGIEVAKLFGTTSMLDGNGPTYRESEENTTYAILQIDVPCPIQTAKLPSEPVIKSYTLIQLGKVSNGGSSTSDMSDGLNTWKAHNGEHVVAAVKDFWVPEGVSVMNQVGARQSRLLRVSEKVSAL